MRDTKNSVKWGEFPTKGVVLKRGDGKFLNEKIMKKKFTKNV